MTDDQHTMGGRCLSRTAGQARGSGVSLQGGWWGPWPRTAPHQQRALVPTLPFGFWSSALSPSLMQTTLPSLPAGPSASSLPSTRRPASPRPMKPRQQHHLLCPQPGCRGQEMARHTPPHLPWGPHSLPLHTKLAIPHCGCCVDSMLGPDACPPLCPGCQLSWASRSRASALDSQAVLPGKSMSSQGSRGPHRQGSPLGAPVVLHSPLGEALTCEGLGAPQASSLDSQKCQGSRPITSTFSAEPSPS